MKTNSMIVALITGLSVVLITIGVAEHKHTSPLPKPVSEHGPTTYRQTNSMTNRTTLTVDTNEFAWSAFTVDTNHSQTGFEFRIQSEHKPSDTLFEFYTNGVTVIQIHLDGSVTLGNTNLDEVSRMFYNALVSSYPHILEEMWNTYTNSKAQFESEH